ncbi:MAG: hypothetical protein ACE5G8_13235 [Anaerolineae bacterium]
MQDLYLGIDIGSTTVKVVALDRAGTLLAHRYLRSEGRPRQTLLRAAADLRRHIPPQRIAAVGLTGSGGEPIARLIGGRHINELVAQTRAVGQYYPQARTSLKLAGRTANFCRWPGMIKAAKWCWLILL